MEKEKKYNFITTQFQIDRKLYKYYSNVKNATDCIKKRRIHMDDPRTFNDPFDGAIGCTPLSKSHTEVSERKLLKSFWQFVCEVPEDSKSEHYEQILNRLVSLYTDSSEEFSDTEDIKLGIDVMEKVYNKLGEVEFSLQELVDTIDAGYLTKYPVVHLNCRMSCFSEIYDSILMWAYYANSHQGVCIEFDLSLLDKKDPLNNQILRSLKKVHYSPLRADKLLPGTEDSVLNFLVSKADVWSHEHEWRLVCNTKEEFLPFDCISNIFVGVKFDTDAPKYKELLKAVDTHKSLKVHQCRLSNEKFQIEVREIYNSYYHTLLSKSSEETSSELVTV